MGQQVSKDTRARLEHCSLEELLTDDQYIEELQRHLPELPKRSHSNLAKILTSWEKTRSQDSHSGSQSHPPPKDRNSIEWKLRPLWLITSKDIAIPESVAEPLKRDHYNLLRQMAATGIGLKSPEDHYEYTCGIETRRGLDRILWRFLTTSYHDIIFELDDTEQRCSTRDDGGIAFVVAIICQSRKHDPKKVRKRVMDWVKIGRRYRRFMNALSPGCIVLFPEKTSDLIWENYVPIKGDTFAKVTQFLRDLGMVDKCEEEGWNDLSDKILKTLHEPFRSLVPFQFQPQTGNCLLAQVVDDADTNSSLAQVVDDADTNSSLALADDADIHRSEPSILGHEREIQDMDVDPPSRTLNPRPLPRPANRVVKTKRKDTTSVRRQLQTFARAPTQCWASAPNDSGQWHLATNHQDDGSINDRARDPLTDISLNATNVHSTATHSPQHMQDVDSSLVSPPSSQLHEHGHDVDQRQRTGESISDILRQDSEDGCPEPAPQQSGAAPAGLVTSSLRAIQFEKHTLQQIVLERPNDILGGIWLSRVRGYPPFVSLRLPRALDIIVKPSGQEVYVPEPYLGASSTDKATYLIKLDCFKQTIQRDGFGVIFWNECGEEAFVTMEVLDESLVADIIRGAVPD